MIQPQQRVVIYQGVSPLPYYRETMERHVRDMAKAPRQEELKPCSRCGRKVRVTKDGKLRKHYVSPRDKIHCMAPVKVFGR